MSNLNTNEPADSGSLASNQTGLTPKEDPIEKTEPKTEEVEEKGIGANLLIAGAKGAVAKEKEDNWNDTLGDGDVF